MLIFESSIPSLMPSSCSHLSCMPAPCAAADREELAELDAMLAQAEAEAEAEEIGEEGLGDLLDDFILTAVGRHEEGTGADEADDGRSWKGKESSASEVSSAPSDSESEDEDFESEAGDGLGELRGEGSVQSRWPGRTAPKAGSIASTYWREERQDRRGELTTLDDRCEETGMVLAFHLHEWVECSWSTSPLPLWEIVLAAKVYWLSAQACSHLYL